MLQKKAERCLADAVACLGNDAADVQIRMQAMFVKSEEAARLFKQALAAREKALPANHGDIAASLLGLAVAKELQGNSAEAEPLFARAIPILHLNASQQQAVLSAVQILCDSGKLLRLDGPIESAEQIHRRALSLSQDLLGKTHPSTLQSIFDLAVSCDVRGLQDADSFYSRVFAVQENYFAVSAFLAKLANAYAQLAKSEAAERMYCRALSLREKACGPGHLDLVPVLQEYANFRGQLCNDHEKEARLYELALAISEKNLGEENPSTAALALRAANACMMNAELDKAVKLFERFLPIREQVLSGTSLQYGRELRCLALTYALLEQYERSQQALERVLCILEGTAGADPNEIVDVGTSLLAIYYEQNKISEAKPLLDRMLALSETKCAPDSPAAENLKALLAEINNDAP